MTNTPRTNIAAYNGHADLLRCARELECENARMKGAMKHIHDTLIHIATCASIPERDAEELADYVSGFLPNVLDQTDACLARHVRSTGRDKHASCL